MVVIAAEEYERLHKLEKSESPEFTELLLAMPQDGGTFERRPLELREIDL